MDDFSDEDESEGHPDDESDPDEAEGGPEKIDDNGVHSFTKPPAVTATVDAVPGHSRPCNCGGSRIQLCYYRVPCATRGAPHRQAAYPHK